MAVSISWSLVVPPNRGLSEIAQDLDLLWPGQVAGATPDAGDADLRSFVERRGFRVAGGARLPLLARNRRDMGTRVPAEPAGQASFVTFYREGEGLGPTRTATYIRIPWTTKLANPDWLVSLRFETPDLIAPRPATWVERVFWGERQQVSIGFGDVGKLTLYPMYFGRREYVVRLAPDFSMVLISFEEAGHLKIEDVVPASASRRPSEARQQTEVVQLPLVASEGLTPQVLKVGFSYFSGHVAWRPILISMLFLGLGNLTGPLVLMLVRRLGRVARARVQVGRRRAEGVGQQSGVILSRETLAGLVPGETTYEEVVRRCGPHAEERERLPSADRRTLVYRGQRVVPHRGRSFGWFATVAHWDVEHHEVEIEFEHDRVRDVDARLRRSRMSEPQSA